MTPPRLRGSVVRSASGHAVEGVHRDPERAATAWVPRGSGMTTALPASGPSAPPAPRQRAPSRKGRARRYQVSRTTTPRRCPGGGEPEERGGKASTIPAASAHARTAALPSSTRSDYGQVQIVGWPRPLRHPRVAPLFASHLPPSDATSARPAHMTTNHVPIPATTPATIPTITRRSAFPTAWPITIPSSERRPDASSFRRQPAPGHRHGRRSGQRHD